MRDAEFRRIDNYLAGRYFENMAEGSALRDEPKRRSKDGTFQIIAPIIQAAVVDAAALESIPFTIEVPPEKATQASEKQAKKIEKYLYSVWRNSKENALRMKTAYEKHAYGFSITGALPDLKEERIRLISYSPKNAYPVFEMDGDFLRELFICFTATPRAVKDQFANFQYDGDIDVAGVEVEVVLYFSKTHRMNFANGQLLTSIQHDWGFVPFVIVPCQLMPGMVGIGDVHQSVGLVMGLNKLLQQGHKAIDETLDNPLVFFGITPEELKQNPPIRYGNKLVYCIPDGDVKRLPPTTGPLPETFQLTSYYQDLLNGTGNYNAARQGVKEGAYVSRGGQQMLLSGVGDRIDAGKRVESERYSMLNEFILRLTEKHFPKKDILVQGYMGRTPFRGKLKGDDIAGYYLNNINYRPVIYSDSGRMTAETIQLYTTGFISRFTAQNRIGEDPEFEAQQMKQEMMQDAALKTLVEQYVQQHMATLPALPGAAPADPNAPTLASGGAAPDAEAAQYALEQGKTSGLGATSPPAPNPPALGAAPAALPASGAAPSGGMPTTMDLQGNPTMAQGAVTPAFIPAEHTDGLLTPDIVAPIVRGINPQKMNGKVYLVGQMLEVGNSEQAELKLTNNLDKATVNNAARGTPLEGKIHYPPPIKDGSEPKEPFIDISPGTDGFTIGGTNNALPFQSAGAMGPGAGSPGPMDQGAIQ